MGVANNQEKALPQSHKGHGGNQIIWSLCPTLCPLWLCGACFYFLDLQPKQKL